MYYGRKDSPASFQASRKAIAGSARSCLAGKCPGVAPILFVEPLSGSLKLPKI
jgi:hypothetical protein